MIAIGSTNLVKGVKVMIRDSGGYLTAITLTDMPKSWEHMVNGLDVLGERVMIFAGDIETTLANVLGGK